jgi:hypothetical protein
MKKPRPARVAQRVLSAGRIFIWSPAMRYALFAFALLAAGSASAQEAPVTQPAGPLTPAAPPEDAPAARSGALSLGLSAGSSLVGVGALVGAIALSDGGCDDDACQALSSLGMLGTLFGPSAGHIYSGEYVHAFAASTLRFVAFAAAGPPLARAAREGTPLREVGAGPLIGGAILAGLIVGDSLDALRAPARKAERKARRQERQRAATLSLSPLIPADGGLGLQVGGGF